MSLPLPAVAVGLLVASNVFMTFAWYGRLRFRTAPLLAAIPCRRRPAEDHAGWLWLGERLGWQHGVGFALICLGAWFVLHDEV